MAQFEEETRERFLLFHKVTKSLFESHGGSAEEMLDIEDCLIDVTNIDEYEDRFKKQKKEDRWNHR